jgi:hypothetical protein
VVPSAVPDSTALVAAVFLGGQLTAYARQFDGASRFDLAIGRKE